MINFNTDMAIERRNIFRKIKNLDEIPGVEVKTIDDGENIKTNIVKITNKEGEDAIGKLIGTYITIDINNLKIAENSNIDEASKVVTRELKEMINKYIKSNDDILVVGIGNEYVTPDSLRTESCFRN